MNNATFNAIENNLKHSIGLNLKDVLDKFSDYNYHIYTLIDLYNDLCGGYGMYEGTLYHHVYKKVNQLLKHHAKNDIVVYYISSNPRVIFLTKSSLLKLFKNTLFITASKVEHDSKWFMYLQDNNKIGLKEKLKFSSYYLAIKSAVPSDALFKNKNFGGFRNIYNNQFDYQNPHHIKYIQRCSEQDTKLLKQIDSIITKHLNNPNNTNIPLNPLHSKLRRQSKLMHLSHECLNKLFS